MFVKVLMTMNEFDDDIPRNSKAWVILTVNRGSFSMFGLEDRSADRRQLMMNTISFMSLIRFVQIGLNWRQYQHLDSKFKVGKNWLSSTTFIEVVLSMRASVTCLVGNILTWFGNFLGTRMCPKIPGIECNGQVFLIRFLLCHISTTCPYTQSCVLTSTSNLKNVFKLSNSSKLVL